MGWPFLCELGHFSFDGTRIDPISSSREIFDYWFNRDCARLLASAEAVAAIPVPSVPYTLIAGTAGPRGRASPFGDDPNDGVVAVDELPIHAADQPLLFPVWHTLMMNDRLVKQAILAAFSTRA